MVHFPSLCEFTGGYAASFFAPVTLNRFFIPRMARWCYAALLALGFGALGERDDGALLQIGEKHKSQVPKKMPGNWVLMVFNGIQWDLLELHGI